MIAMTLSLIAAVPTYVAFKPLLMNRGHSPSDGSGSSADLTLPVTFPDGTHLEVAFPASRPPGRLGIQALSFGRIEVPGEGICCERPIQILQGSPDDQPLLTDTVVATFPGAQGSMVELREGSTAGAELYLVYVFGGWTALVYDTVDGGMSEEQRKIWASHLAGRVTEDGFLVLEADPPLSLESLGTKAGPQLWLLGPGHAQEVGLFPGPCDPDDPDEVDVTELGPTGWFASWCPEDGLAQVHAYGGTDRSFVEQLVEGLVVRDGAAPASGGSPWI